ncbi:MAG TPA: hypothetical protein VJI12_04410 [archaeon]|nr:hypothetical protein [archaeon]
MRSYIIDVPYRELLNTQNNRLVSADGSTIVASGTSFPSLVETRNGRGFYVIFEPDAERLDVTKMNIPDNLDIYQKTDPVLDAVGHASSLLHRHVLLRS